MEGHPASPEPCLKDRRHRLAMAWVFPPPPDDETTSTLYRFCLSHGLSLDHIERSAEGIELSKVARERQLPLIRVRERIERQWIKSRLYPVSFLNEWLARYTQAQAEATAAAPSPEAQPTAANG